MFAYLFNTHHVKENPDEAEVQTEAYSERFRPLPVALSVTYFSTNRLEEYDNMGSKYQRLKAAAHELDRRLRGERPDGSKDPRFRTLVHGDFKSANLLFSTQAPVSCAAFDFQYCGEGGSSAPSPADEEYSSAHLRSCVLFTCCQAA